MPYNNTPIAPSTEVSGQVSLPLARVQKIIAADEERIPVSRNATFAIARATEMFIQHLAEATLNVVKAERKPRRNIQYRDVSTAVAKTDNLEFLADVVPKTTTLAEFKKKRAAEGRGIGEKGLEGLGAKEKKVVNGDGMGNPKVAYMKTNGNGNGQMEEDEQAAHWGGPEAEDSIVVAPVSIPGVPGSAQFMPLPQQQQQPDDMEVDEESSTLSQEELDPAALQLQMEMRGPRAYEPSPLKRESNGFATTNGSA